MRGIQQITGIRFTPEKLLAAMAKNRRLGHIECTPLNVLYSPCWVFAFHVAFELSGKKSRHIGFWGGVDELHLTPGLLRDLPESAAIEAGEANILADKMTVDEAAELAWNYSKGWVSKKHRMQLFKAPVRTRTETHKLYKPLYLLKFYNRALEQTLYKTLDSLTGELDALTVESSPAD